MRRYFFRGLARRSSLAHKQLYYDNKRIRIMINFDRESLTDNNTLERETQFYYRVEDIVELLESYQNNLDELEAKLNKSWVYGRLGGNEYCACGALYLKQLLVFIKHNKIKGHNALKSGEKDISTLIQQLKLFAEQHGSDNPKAIVLNSRLLYQFEFNEIKIIDTEDSKNILVQEILYLSENLLADRKNLEAFIKAFFEKMPFVSLSDKRKLIKNINNINVLEELIYLYHSDDELKQDFLNQANILNNYNIKHHIQNFRGYTKYIDLYNLDLVMEGISDSKSKQQYSDILIDIIEDMSQHSKTIELHTLSYDEMPYGEKTIKDIFSRLSDNKIDATENYERLKAALNCFITNNAILFDYHVVAMLMAYDCLGWIVPNHNRLVQGIKNNKPKGTRNGYLYDIFSYTELIDDSVILSCLASHYHTDELIRYLNKEKGRFIGDSDKTNQLFDAFCLYLQKESEEPHYLGFENSIKVILSYPLNLEQKQSLVDIISTAKNEVTLPEYIRYLNKGLSLIKKSIKSKPQKLSVNELIDKYIECELFLNPHKVLKPDGVFTKPMSVISDALESTKTSLCYDHEYIQQYPYDSGAMDFIKDLFSIIPIDIEVLEDTQYENLSYDSANETFEDALERQKQYEQLLDKTSVSLSDIPLSDSNCSGFHLFEYDNQQYYFNSYETSELLYFIASVANRFLSHINHSKRLCKIGSMREGGVNIIAINLTKFEKLSKNIKIPLKEINSSMY